MSHETDPYFGDEALRQLQRVQDAAVEEHKELPGAVIHARTFSSDDLGQLGLDRLHREMARNGRITLRGARAAEREAAAEALQEFGAAQHHWDLFLGDAAALEEACRPHVKRSLPKGLRLLSVEELDDAALHRAQVFMDRQGVSPFSKDALAGRLFPAKLLVLCDREEEVVGTAFAAMTHNSYSPFKGFAWVGLIAIHPDLRGQAMGKYMDALGNLAAIEDLGAQATMEFVAQDNLPSRRMLEACGLRQDPERGVTMFSRSAVRLTR